MKTLLLIAALMGFTAIGSYAGDNGCGGCKKLKEKHTYSRVIPRSNESTTESNLEDNTIHTVILYEPVRENLQCNTFRRGNMLITECPILNDNGSQLNMSRESEYMGNYPQQTGNCTKMENVQNVAPSDPSFCFYNCSGR